MKNLYKIFGIFILGVTLYACSSSPVKNVKKEKEEPVVIANDSLEYEIIILDIGFNAFLNSRAKPIGYYSKEYMEMWNEVYVTTWNNRAQFPTRYDPEIYRNIIDYDRKIDYGMDVNYKLFNYFQFAQLKYNMRLDAGGTGGPIRIK